MVHLDELTTPNDHPIATQLASLKAAVSQFQDESHSASLKLQRHTLDSARLNERVAQLERENALLTTELTVLRANPHPESSSQSSSHPAVLQVQQLSLSLRALSDKLTLTEEALLECTNELTNARAEAGRSKFSMENAYELAANVRGREEAGRQREAELEWKLTEAEEKIRMSDLVMKEYADLVRSLEGRPSRTPSSAAFPKSPLGSRENGSHISLETPSSSATATLSQYLAEGKEEIHALVAKFQAQTDHLQAELNHAHAELATVRAQLDAEHKNAEVDRIELSRVKQSLKKLELDDNTAAKMVSRYMTFSQKSANTLQKAMEVLKTRHASTVDTLSSQIVSLSQQLRDSQNTTDRLRNSLDELGGDLMKESFGRRNEARLRLRLVNREEQVHEGLKRWIRGSEEALRRVEGDETVHEPLLSMVQDAKILLESLDGPVSDTSSLSGSLARLITVQSVVDGLLEELKDGTARRVKLETMLPVMGNGTAKHEETSNGSFIPIPESQDSKSKSHSPPPPLPPSKDIPVPHVHQPQHSHSSARSHSHSRGRPLSGKEQIADKFAVPEQKPEITVELVSPFSVSQSLSTVDENGAPQHSALGTAGSLSDKAGSASLEEDKEHDATNETVPLDAEKITAKEDVFSALRTPAASLADVKEGSASHVPVPVAVHVPIHSLDEGHDAVSPDGTLPVRHREKLTAREDEFGIGLSLASSAAAGSSSSVDSDSEPLDEVLVPPSTAVQAVDISHGDGDGDGGHSPLPRSRSRSVTPTPATAALEPVENVEESGASASADERGREEQAQPPPSPSQFILNVINDQSPSPAENSNVHMSTADIPTSSNSDSISTSSATDITSDTIPDSADPLEASASLPPRPTSDVGSVAPTDPPSAVIVNAELSQAESESVRDRVPGSTGESDVYQPSPKPAREFDVVTARVLEDSIASHSESVASAAGAGGSPISISVPAVSIVEVVGSDSGSGIAETHSETGASGSSVSIPAVSIVEVGESDLVVHESVSGVPEREDSGVGEDGAVRLEIEAVSVDGHDSAYSVPETETTHSASEPASARAVTPRDSSPDLPVHADDDSLAQEEEVAPPQPPPPHPLLQDLANVSHRYDVLQQAFRDCHMALEALKKSVSSSSDTAGSFSASPSKPQLIGGMSQEIVTAVLDRLTDYTENARVELEIKAADEALLAKGYETLLSVPGALSSFDGDEGASRPDEVEVEIQMFINGTDTNIQKAHGGLKLKLDNLQHDIAALKRAIHTEVEEAPISGTLSPAKSESSGGWTSWIRGSPSRSSSPAPASATFGNIMTTPRLRQAPSLVFQNKKIADPVSHLGLRVPMPSFALHSPSVQPASPPRARTVSTMYMLGLGAMRSPSGVGGHQRQVSMGAAAGSPATASSSRGRGGVSDSEVETDTDSDDTDIE